MDRFTGTDRRDHGRESVQVHGIMPTQGSAASRVGATPCDQDGRSVRPHVIMPPGTADDARDHAGPSVIMSCRPPRCRWVHGIVDRLVERSGNGGPPPSPIARSPRHRRTTSSLRPAQPAADSQISVVDHEATKLVRGWVYSVPVFEYGSCVRTRGRGVRGIAPNRAGHSRVWFGKVGVARHPTDPRGAGSDRAVIGRSVGKRFARSHRSPSAPDLVRVPAATFLRSTHGARADARWHGGVETR
jgi:hypothetical protein